jgi:small subunit ribosomal protein S20
LGSKSAQKVARASARRNTRNKMVRSQIKTDIGKAEKLVAEGNKEEAKKAVNTAMSVLDKAAGKKVLHANNAARRKSRMMKKLNKGAQPKAKATEKATK